MADPPPKKKLPFKKHTKRAAPAPTPGDDKTDDDGLDLFSRRKEMAPVLEADRRRRIEKEKRKAEAQAREKFLEEVRQRRWKSESKPVAEEEDEKFYDAEERQASPTGDDEVVATDESTAIQTGSFNKPMTPPSSKRKRAETGSASSRKHQTPSSARPDRSRSLRNAEIPTPSKHSTRATGKQAVISLDSDEEVEVKPKRADSVEILDDLDENPAPDVEEEEDDEFAEYIRKAEEEKRRIAEELEGASAMVFATSEIPDTKALTFKLKLDQHLVKARDSWVKHQMYVHNVQLPCPAADLVISWQRDKVYNYSTLYSLGVRADNSSSSGITGVSRKGLTEDRTKIHLEISTPEIFRRWEEEKQKEEEKAQESDDYETAPVVEEEQKLRVILKARDLEDLGLTVRAATTAKTLIEVYRRMRKTEEANITLWFDGDQIGAETTLEEVDIDDLDTIEVHIN